MKILLVGYIATEATYKLIKTEKTALSCRFSDRFLLLSEKKMDESMIKHDTISNIIKDTGHNIEINDIIELSDTGIYGTLWEFADINSVGVEIILDKINIMQETVEIFEYLNINPYTYPSKGSWLIRSEKAYDLADTFNQLGIKASVIGYETNGNDRVVVNKDETRFLTPIDRLIKDEQGIRNYR